MAKDKARYFTFLLYPESIPADWERQLELIGVLIAISPLHDKDKSNVEGQIYKKSSLSRNLCGKKILLLRIVLEKEFKEFWVFKVLLKFK